MKQEKVIRINNIKLKPDHTEAELLKAVKKALRLKNNCDIKSDIIKRSIDARHKPDIMYVYSVGVKKLVINNKDTDLKAFAKKTANNNITYNEKVIYEFPYGRINNYEGAGIKEEDRPVIIGFGPAGMFAALKLSEAGLMPVVYERGDSIEERHRKVDEFWNTGKLDTQSNVQFGEGGAGTFSDGKLNTLVKDKFGRNRFVLETFVEHGAPEEILYENKPHIGTDLLRNVVAGIREEIRSLGGDVRFEAKVTDFVIQDGKLTGLIINDKEEIKTETAILAPGHSARDTFRVLSDRDLEMNPKAFAIGLRVEHPREMIDHSQYGKGADQYDLPAASYKLTYHANNGRSVYSFCMCPGGFVVNASSEPERLTVNGMSNHDRAAKNSNSAIIASVTPEDFDGNDALAGVRFQQKWEEKAFSEGKGRIPVQTLKDFREGKITESFGEITPNTKGLTSFGNLRNCLPEPVSEAISEGMQYFDTKIKGFNREDTILCGIEARTSSPLRIERDQGFESNIKGIYPCGEGAGFAGGITSAAMDGIKVAQALVTV